MSFTVQEVAQLIRQAKEHGKPYVFFTGAGCSKSAGVPTAIELINEIREKFLIQTKNIDAEKDKYNYGMYMSALDKHERRQLLHPYIIKNKQINWAHIALACLMKAEYIERVLTFNFDSILSRACNLIGLHPSIYDFATANPHLYHLINDPAIVHLHGQGTGFIQLNTSKETKDHTPNLNDFIAATLNSNPSLFIGYSGNADEFFPLLEEKFSEQHRIIWTGRKNNIEDIDAESVKKFLQQNNSLTHYIGDIDADLFLIELAKELNCFPPELFLNPYKFLNNQLEVIEPYPLGDGLDILENLSEYLKDQSLKPLNQSLYTAFIHRYPTKESTLGLSEKDINGIMWAYISQAQLFFNTQDFSSSFSLYEKAIYIKKDHRACNINYAICLSEQAKLNEDLNLVEKSINLFEIEISKNLKDVYVLGKYAFALYQKANINKDREIYNKVFRIFEEALKSDPDNIDILGNYGYTLAQYSSFTLDQSYLKLAIKHHKKALSIDPEHFNHLNSYAISLLQLFHFEQDNTLLETAFETISKCLTQSPNETYNLACYYSLKNQKDLCEKSLLHAEKHDNLPKNPLKHLAKDHDLDNIRNEQWFRELLDRLKTKEEDLDKAS